MSKYTELSDLAVAHSKHRFDTRARVQIRVKQMLNAYASYLGAPTGDMLFWRLDGNLNRTGETRPLDQEAPLVLGHQGFWHFCFGIEYKRAHYGHNVTETTKMSMKEADDGSVTVQIEDKQFKVDGLEPATYTPLFDHLFNLSKQGLQKSFEEPNKRIGFLGTDD